MPLQAIAPDYPVEAKVLKGRVALRVRINEQGGVDGVAVVDDGNAEAYRHLLRRRRRELAATAARRVGPRQHLRDVVCRGEPLEHVGAERRGRSDRELHAQVRTMRGRRSESASRRASGVVLSMISTPSRWSASCCAARA